MQSESREKNAPLNTERDVPSKARFMYRITHRAETLFLSFPEQNVRISGDAK